MDAILDLTVSQCAICTSHNSYLTGSQVGFGNNGSADGIRDALTKNARMVELDVTGKDGVPMVCHPISTPMGAIPCTNPITAEECLDVIAEDAFSRTDLPLFLCIQKETDDKEALKALGEMISTRFGSRLLNHCTDLRNIKISDLLGKVAVYTYPLRSGVPELDSIITWSLYWDPMKNMGHKELYKMEDTPVGSFRPYSSKLARVYPDNIIKSKNFDAWRAWRKGIQFVAFNFQHASPATAAYLAVFGDIGIRPISEVILERPEEDLEEDDDPDDPGVWLKGRRENPRNPVAGVPVLGPVVGGVMCAASVGVIRPIRGLVSIFVK